MHTVLVLLVKGLAGGAFVVLFAAIGEVVRPRELAGVFGGAPSVALAGLAVSVIATGAASAALAAEGMTAGAAALIIWCLAAPSTLKRYGALKGSIVTTFLWFAAAFALWAAALR